jgi:hypothetical protein
MATYIVTPSETDTWTDDKRNQFKTRSAADARVEELLAVHPAVRVIRWERDQPVKEERFERRTGATTRPGRSEPPG